MSFPGDEDVQFHSSPLLQSAQQPADQLYAENEDVDLASDYLSDAPSDRNPSLQQSSQRLSSTGVDPAADQPVAENEHEDLLDEDSTDFASVPSRSNKFRGPPSTWRNWTAPERDLAASLDQLQAKDLSVHLYNSFKLRQKNRTRDPSQRAGASKHSGKAKEGSQWIPPKVWAAWPLPPGIVPREHDEWRWEKDAVPLEVYLAKPKRPGQHLKEILFAQVLRKAKDQLRDRPWGDTQHPTDSPIRAPQQLQGRQGSFSGRLGAKEDKQVLSQKPVVMADDQRASEILRPTVQHMMSKLDDLLMGLHHARSSYLSAEDSGSESQSQTSQRSTSRGRPQKGKWDVSKAEVDAEASQDTPSHLDSDLDKHRPGRKKSGSNKRIQHTRSASRRSRSQDFRERKGRLGLRDWSDVVGIASMTGWNQHAVAGTTSRCVNLFGEGIKFRTLEEGKKIQEEHLYLPGTSLPVPNAISKGKSQDTTWQGIENSRGKFEGGMVGGAHVDGFLKPIEGKKSWLYSKKKKLKRRQRSRESSN